MKKRTSIAINKNSYLFAVKYGKRDGYIEKLIEERIQKIGNALFFLRQKHGKDEIVKLIGEIGLPVAKWEQKNTNVSAAHKTDLVTLWEEVTYTGISANELIDTLDKHW